MSGCQEGILVDLSEPVEESPVSLTESIEFMRDASIDILDDVPKYETPLKTVDDLLNISSTSSSPHQPSPLRLIEDETFDFDLPVTPRTNTDNSTPEEDEEEVFFGPVGYRERCVSTIIDSAKKEAKPLSPLKPHEIAEICKEANAVACMISSAASGKKAKKSGKENVMCVKQLNLGMPNDKSLLNLLGKASIKLNNSAGKDVCDSRLNIDSESEICDDTMKGLESFLKNEVVFQQPESEPKSASSVSDSSDSPMRKHNRSGTFTKDTTPINELPASKRRSLPVVEPPKHNSSSAKKEASSKDGGSKSASKLQQTKLQQPSSKLTRTSIPGMNHQIQAPIVKQESAASSEGKPQMKSRLSAGKPGSILPSKTKPVMSKLPTSSSIPTKSQLPQKSALPGPKGRGAPISKLQLMKSSNSQRLSGLQPKNNNNSAKKSGPLKAFAPMAKQDTDKAMSDMTPAKSESIITKNPSTTFSTPTREGSTSSMDSPVSSVKKRRSFLPTPNKTRSGSAGSCPSPCGSRTSSTSSMRSIESPLVGKRRPSFTGNGPQLPFELMDPSSPSALKQRRPLVTNTPNQPKKKPSPWSPIQKRKTHDPYDQAFACTKIQRK